MNLSYFISKRITTDQKEGFASTIHKIAIVIIGVGLAASILSFLIMRGFQQTVKNKIFAFAGHIMITGITMNNSLEEQPIKYHMEEYDHPEKFPMIDHMQEYAHKIGMVKGENEVLGIVMKGVGRSFDQKAFAPKMIDGKFLQFPDSGYSNQVVISKIISDKLKAKVGDNITIHFLQNPPRVRRLKVSGIYETNLSEYFDSKIILGDIRLIRKLNDWSDSIAGGIEVFVKEPNDDRVDAVQEAIATRIDYDLNIERVSDRYSQVFQWLDLVSRQVNIILGVILMVICINMVSIVLILVMERTQMIGLLKALGSDNSGVRSIFMYQGIRLITKGLLFGNALGLTLAYLQYKFQIVKLNAHDYYMDFVPIAWDWKVVGFLNILTFTVVTLVLLVPTMAISRINPIRAIKFD